MMNLDAFRGIKVAAVTKPEAAARTGSSLQLVPNEGGSFRLFKNGRIYPSNTTKEQFALDYYPKAETVDTVTGEITETILGNGIDIVELDKWSGVEMLENGICLAIVPKTKAKLDLYGGTSYEGITPKTSIMEQGASTGGKHLVELVSTIYGVDFKVVPFVDLVLHTDIPLVSPNGIYNLPKIVSRGENKGKESYVRRENIEIFPLTVLVGAAETSKVDSADTETDIHREADILVEDRTTADVLVAPAPVGDIDFTALV